MVNIVLFYVGKSFAFVVGLRSIQHIIVKHVFVCARDELSYLFDLQICYFILMCFILISKRNGVVHMLYAVRVRPSLCNI